MKNATLTILVLIVLVGGTVLLSSFAKENAAGAGGKAASLGVLSLPEDYYDFGDVKIDGGKVEKVFTVTNNGSEEVIINQAYTSCMCTTVVLKDGKGKKLGQFGMPGHGVGSAKTNIAVAPGEEIAATAIFDPAAHGPSGLGLAERVIYLETNSKEKPKVEIIFKANVVK